MYMYIRSTHCARALTCVDVTLVRVTVTVARHAARLRTAVDRVAPVARLAVLTELPDVAGQAAALLDVRHRRADAAAVDGRLQLDVIQEASPYQNSRNFT